MTTDVAPTEPATNRAQGVRAAIYARISKDENDLRAGVARQVKDCRDEIRDRGWSELGVYEDNDKSAYSGGDRAEWRRLLADVQAGHVDAVAAYAADRLTRDIREAEDFIDLARAADLKLVTIRDGDYVLARATGRKRFREDAVKSRGESETMSERISRQRDAAAEEGRPHGMVAYGYRRVRDLDAQGRLIGSRDELFPEQAEVVRETARRLLAGESMRSIVRSLNDRGSLSPKGAPWESTTLRQVMLRDRNAGLRRHRGKVIGKADWEPIYDEGTHDRVKALLTDPARTSGMSNKGATRKHLLSGIARCGRCGGVMRVTPATVYRGKTLAAKYQCRDCLRVARKQDVVDQVVTAVIIERLSRPDALRALASGRPERAEELERQIAEAEARLELAADGFADGTLSHEQLRRISTKLGPQVEEWRLELASCAPREGLLELAGPEAEAKWTMAPLDVQRAVVDLLLTVTVMPVGAGVRFDPSQIQIEWKA